MLTIVRSLVLAALVAGCAASSPAGLAGRTFIVTSVTTAGAPHSPVPGTSIRVTFSGEGRLGISAGCNTMGASYRVEGGVLLVDAGATTEMGCDPDRMAQDDWVFAFFGSGPTVLLAGSDLTLTAGDTIMRLTDREVLEPDLSLVGPTWTVTSIVAGDAVSSVPAGVVATLRFGADGRFEVATGCNQGGGRYALDGATLRFSDLILTEMACAGAAGEMEAAVLAVLEADVVSVAIDASTLTLHAGGRGLTLQGS